MGVYDVDEADHASWYCPAVVTLMVWDKV